MSNIHFEPEPGSSSAMPNISPPKTALWAAMGLVALTFTLAIGASQFGIGKFDSRPYDAVATRWLRFADATDGAILVYDAESPSSAPVTRIAPASDQFLRGSIRALARRRMLAHLNGDEPFALTLWRDGRITLDDARTSGRIDVKSFGHTQEESFAALFTNVQGPLPPTDTLSLTGVEGREPMAPPVLPPSP